MKAPISVGYRLPALDRVQAGPWLCLMGVASDELSNPAELEEWDYFTDVIVRRELVVDLDGIRSDCGLDDAANIGLALSWHSSRTNLRGYGSVVDADVGSNFLSLSLKGEQLGGRLTLGCRLVVLHDQLPKPATPSRAGSILWSDEHRVTLEGSGSRFPVVQLDFGTAGVGGGRVGAWALHCDSDDLDASALGSLRLLVNTAHPRVRLTLDQPDSAEASLIGNMMQFDIYRQLVVYALNHQELEDTFSYEEGTLGAALMLLIRRIYPDRSLEELRGVFRTVPGDFEAELQGRVGLLL
jgi:hypothetical protein